MTFIIHFKDGPNPIGEEVIRKTYEKYKDILKV